jgi:hypothetical protein
MTIEKAHRDAPPPMPRSRTAGAVICGAATSSWLLANAVRARRKKDLPVLFISAA